MRVMAISGAAEAKGEAIAADRLVEGAPVATTRLDWSREDKLFAGEWSASVGAWRVKYDECEFCHVLEGVCELVDDDDAVQRFAAGDSFVVEPGFSGIWRVIEPMKKRFFVVYP